MPYLIIILVVFQGNDEDTFAIKMKLRGCYIRKNVMCSVRDGKMKFYDLDISHVRNLTIGDFLVFELKDDLLIPSSFKLEPTSGTRSRTGELCSVVGFVLGRQGYTLRSSVDETYMFYLPQSAVPGGDTVGGTALSTGEEVLVTTYKGFVALSILRRKR